VRKSHISFINNGHLALLGLNLPSGQGFMAGEEIAGITQLQLARSALFPFPRG
jgi:hypothetical protein